MTTILDILKESVIDSNWTIYAAGIYSQKVTLNATESVASWWTDTFQGGSAGVNRTRFRIGSVKINNTLFVEETGAGQLASTNTFYFDVENQILYVHPEDDISIFTVDVYIGIAHGYSDEDVSYINDFPYLPLITNTVVVANEVDSVFLSKMSFQSQTVTLDNSGGYFDEFTDRSLYGTICELFSYDSSTDTLTSIGKYSIEDETLSNLSYTIRLQDRRKKDNITIPSTFYEASDFDDSENENIGTLIPEGYGAVKGVPCIEIAKVHATNRRFKFATDATAITTVYAKEDDVWSSVTPTATYVTDAEFELAPADCQDDEGNLLAIKADVTLRDLTNTPAGRGVSNPVDIIIYMFYRYVQDNKLFGYGLDVSGSWAESSDFDDVGFYMNEQKKLYEWIEILQNSSNKNFQFFYRTDGLGFCKQNDNARTPTHTIGAIGVDIISDVVVAERDNSDFASSIEITYAKDYSTGVAQSYIDTSEYTYVLNKYGTNQDLTGDDAIESLLSTASEAQDKAETLIEDLKDVHDVYECDVKLDEFDDVEILDTLTAYLGYPDTVAEIITSSVIDRDYAGASVIDRDYAGSSRLNRTYAESTEVIAEGRVLFGERTCKVVGYDKSIQDNILTLRLRSV